MTELLWDARRNLIAGQIKEVEDYDQAHYDKYRYVGYKGPAELTFALTRQFMSDFIDLLEERGETRWDSYHYLSDDDGAISVDFQYGDRCLHFIFPDFISGDNDSENGLSYWVKTWFDVEGDQRCLRMDSKLLTIDNALEHWDWLFTV